MNIRTTLDPISLRDVPDPMHHPFLYEGDGENGIEIFFESEANRQRYLEMKLADHKVIRGDDSDDYIPEG